MSILDQPDNPQASGPQASAPQAQSSNSLPPSPLMPIPQPMSNVPVITSLSLAAQGTQNGISLIGYNQVPDQNWARGLPLHSIPIAIWNMSPSQAKDLMLILMEMVPKHEEMYGELTTPYMHEKGLRDSATRQ